MTLNEDSTRDPHAEARALIKAIGGDRSAFMCISTLDRSKPEGDKSRFSNHFFVYPAHLEQALCFASESDRNGLDVYVGAHLFRSRSRKKDHAVPLVACYAELDGGEIPADAPEPSIVIESSPGKKHVYYVLSEPVKPQDGEELNKRLAIVLGADPSGSDLSQLLRPPGTHNNKYADRPLVHVLNRSGKQYEPAELDKFLPPLPTKPEARQCTRAESEPPVRLNPTAYQTYFGERPVRKPDGDVDRSETLYKIGIALAKAGALTGTITDALAERDGALGFDKYTDRPEQYEAIAQKAVAEWDSTLEMTEALSGRPRETAFNAASLLRRVFPEPAFIVEDFIPEGTTVLSGAPKIGKSWAGLDIAIATATGREAFGKRVAKPGGVLYLALEDNPRRLAGRVKKVCSAHVAPVNPFHGGALDDHYELDFSILPDKLDFWTDCETLERGGLDKIEEWRLAHPDARLAIIDTLQRFREATGRGNNQYEADYRALAQIQQYSSASGLSFLILHHNRKAASEDPLEMVSGSFGVTGAVDSVLVLRRIRGRADAALFVTGRDVREEKDFALNFDPESARWSVLGAAADVRNSAEHAAILAELQRAETPLSPSDVAAFTGQKAGSVRTRLIRMAKAGEIELVERGKYRLKEENKQNNTSFETTELLQL